MQRQANSLSYGLTNKQQQKNQSRKKEANTKTNNACETKDVHYGIYLLIKSNFIGKLAATDNINF